MGLLKTNPLMAKYPVDMMADGIMQKLKFFLMMVKIFSGEHCLSNILSLENIVLI